MRRIMFNDRFGLTEAVLEGKKTVTRRIVKVQPNSEIKVFGVEKAREGYFYAGSYYHTNSACRISEFFMAPYKVGEIVAVVQSYATIAEDHQDVDYFLAQVGNSLGIDDFDGAGWFGWKNKMFVKADLMPHQIRILDVRAEKLQAITKEDCLREGITYHSNINWRKPSEPYRCGKIKETTARRAFAILIDKISGKGTWERNPLVWRIEFELIK